MYADAISPVFPSPAAQNGKAPESAGGAPTARFFRTGLHFFQKTLDLRAALWYNTECCHLGVAQLVARYLGVVEAASSSLVTQTKFLWKRNKNRVEIVWFQPCFCAF